MITLAQTLAEQENLERLCSYRPVNTPEIFYANRYYGMESVYKHYAGLPQSYALKAVVPHGIHIGTEFVWSAEANAPLPVVFCYPSYREVSYRKQTGKVVTLAASPFLYALHLLLLRNQPKPARRGTIFFPSHSLIHATVDMDFESLADVLATLGEAYQPITVCVYWKDFELGHHIPFQRRGMRIVCAGHREDPLFLFRFYHLCSQHAYASGNSIGSHTFFSVKAGCSFFWLEGPVHTLVAPNQANLRNIGKHSHAMMTSLQTLFGTPQDSMSQEQLAVVDTYLGAEHIQTPRRLRQQILAAELLDKLGWVACWNGREPVPMVPYFYIRTAYSLARPVIRPIKNLVKKLFRSYGFDIVRYLPPTTTETDQSQ